MTRQGTLWQFLHEHYQDQMNLVEMKPAAVETHILSACDLCLDSSDHSYTVYSESLQLEAMGCEPGAGSNRYFCIIDPDEEADRHALIRTQKDLLLSHEALFMAAAGELRFTMIISRGGSSGISIFKKISPARVLISFRDPVFKKTLQQIEAAVETKPEFNELITRTRNRRDKPRFANPAPESYFQQFAERSNNRNLELQTELDLLNAVVKVQDAVSRELDFDRQIEIVGGILLDTLKFQFGELSQYHAESGLQQLALWSSEKSYSTPEGLTIHLDRNLEERVFQGGDIYHLHKMPASPYVLNHKLVSLLGIHDGLLIPIFTEKKRIGLIKLYYSGPIHVTEVRKQWLRDLGKIMSISLENAMEHTRAFQLATKDGLTNIYNRRYFEEQFYLELKRVKRYHKPLSLLMLDVDFFKNYNDLNGHLKGDEVLIRVAQLIKESLRATDFIARYGGEEFIVLLSEADIDQAMIVADKIRARIESEEFSNQANQPNGNLTVSIGVAQLTPDVKRFEEIIKRADDALYRAKEHGKNVCVRADFQ